MAGSQDYAIDPRNAEVRVWLNGRLTPRGEAKVSIFDAGFCMGDGVWEGVRLHKGRLLFLDAHLDRLFAGARAIKLDIGMNRAGLKRALGETLAANAMSDGVHVRLMVTRGVKATASQDPRNAIGPATVAIVAEHKRPSPPAGGGLALACVAQRCTSAAMFDMRLNSHSRLNLIIALLQAIEAGGDEALMLDPSGLVSSCNATNFFVVRGKEILTSKGDYCFNGITRGHVIDLCRREGLAVRLTDFTLAEAIAGEEAFVTGTMGGITPVRRIDGRDLPAPPGAITLRLQELYEALKDADAARERRALSGEPPLRIAMWSGPRNLSTAMMRSFENRPDTTVIDEPFYGAYLHLTGIAHPMRDRVLATTVTDWREVVEILTRQSGGDAAISYEKHITTHMLPQIYLGWMARRRNAFLIRAPERVLASYVRRREAVTAADIGFGRQAELFEQEADRLGTAPPVLDAEDILAEPRGMLRALCDALAIPFVDRMLSWPAGTRPTDGVWAPIWYGTVQASTGFAPPSPTTLPVLDTPLRAIAEAARPLYDRLAQHRIRPSSENA